MTYTMAKMIIWNPQAYEPRIVRKAAVWILSRLTARPEDLGQATNLLA